MRTLHIPHLSMHAVAAPVSAVPDVSLLRKIVRLPIEAVRAWQRLYALRAQVRRARLRREPWIYER